jgi:hypothetical protein
VYPETLRQRGARLGRERAQTINFGRRVALVHDALEIDITKPAGSARDVLHEPLKIGVSVAVELPVKRLHDIGGTHKNVVQSAQMHRRRGT